MSHAVRTNRTAILAALAAFVAVALMAAAIPSGSDAAKRKKRKTPSAKVTTPPLVGIGDNNAPMFADQNYKALGLKVARRIVPYDFYQDPVQLQYMTAWLAGAQADGVQPLISFEHSYTYPTKLPTVAEYAASLAYLRDHWPWVTTISPWNEANHKSQPTINNPKRAAQYYNYTRKVCKGCTIVAADVLDQKNMLPWLRKFMRYAKKPKIWGLHTYTDTNRKKSWKKSTTLKFLRATKGEVWLTEAGGIVAFNNTYAYDPVRAAGAITRTLNLGFRSKRIKRIYLYCWYGVMSDGSSGFPFRWDSGIVGPDGTPRPGYQAIQAWMAAHPRTSLRKRSRHHSSK